MCLEIVLKRLQSFLFHLGLLKIFYKEKEKDLLNRNKYQQRMLATLFQYLPSFFLFFSHNFHNLSRQVNVPFSSPF